jgi:hypothetical protein
MSDEKTGAEIVYLFDQVRRYDPDGVEFIQPKRPPRLEPADEDDPTFAQPQVPERLEFDPLITAGPWTPILDASLDESDDVDEPPQAS